MSFVPLHFEIEGTVETMLASLNNALGPVMLGVFLKEEAQPIINARTERRFVGQGDETVGPWPGLAQYTKNDRAALGFPTSPAMTRSGALREFVTGAGKVDFIPTGASIKWPNDTGDAVLKSKVKVAQKGQNPNKKAGWAPVPARPVLALGEIDMVATHAALEHWLLGWMMRAV